MLTPCTEDAGGYPPESSISKFHDFESTENLVDSPPRHHCHFRVSSMQFCWRTFALLLRGNHSSLSELVLLPRMAKFFRAFCKAAKTSAKSRNRNGFAFVFSALRLSTPTRFALTARLHGPRLMFLSYPTDFQISPRLSHQGLPHIATSI